MRPPAGSLRRPILYFRSQARSRSAQPAQRQHARPRQSRTKRAVSPCPRSLYLASSTSVKVVCRGRPGSWSTGSLPEWLPGAPATSMRAASGAAARPANAEDDGGMHAALSEAGRADMSADARRLCGRGLACLCGKNARLGSNLGPCRRLGNSAAQETERSQCSGFSRASPSARPPAQHLESGHLASPSKSALPFRSPSCASRALCAPSLTPLTGWALREPALSEAAIDGPRSVASRPCPVRHLCCRVWPACFAGCKDLHIFQAELSHHWTGGAAVGWKGI